MEPAEPVSLCPNAIPSSFLIFSSQGPTAAAGEPWLVQDVVNWLMSIGMHSYVPIFRKRGITGPLLLNLKDESLKSLPVEVRRSPDQRQF